MKPVLQASSDEWSGGHGLIHAVEILHIGVESKNVLTALFGISSEECLVFFAKSMKDNRGSSNDVSLDRCWLRQIVQNWLRPYARIRITFDELIPEPTHWFLRCRFSFRNNNRVIVLPPSRMIRRLNCCTIPGSL